MGPWNTLSYSKTRTDFQFHNQKLTGLQNPDYFSFADISIDETHPHRRSFNISSAQTNRFVNSFKVALVTWTESVGLTLVHRDLSTMHLRTPYGEILVFSILQIFPFTSETKRMGIIVKVSNSVVFEVQTFSSLKDVLKCESSLIFALSDCQMAHQKIYLIEYESSVIATWS